MIRTLYQFCLKLNESSEHQDESATRLGQNVPQELSEVSIIIKFLSSMQSLTINSNHSNSNSDLVLFHPGMYLVSL